MKNWNMKDWNWDAPLKGDYGTITYTGPDGVERIIMALTWELRPIVKHWFDQWIRRVPRG